MLSEEQSRQASDLLWRHWQEGRVFAAMPDHLRPNSRAEGYRIQGELELRSPRPLFGWKIAATSGAGQRHIGVAGPLAGRLLAERAQPGGSELKLGANRMRVAEPEFAFRMAGDLPPRAQPYDVSEVLAAVATLHPAIEIPDSRFSDFASAGAAQLIADNACADRFVLGQPAPVDWRRIDLVAHRVTARLDAGEPLIGSGAHVLGDPRLALTWLANELSGLGLTLRADQVVTTGTCMTPLPIRPGQMVVADFGPLGGIAVQFV